MLTNRGTWQNRLRSNKAKDIFLLRGCVIYRSLFLFDFADISILASFFCQKNTMHAYFLLIYDYAFKKFGILPVT